jgi:hypothetical protein
MEMNAYFVFIAFLGIVAVTYFLWLDHKKSRMLRLRVKKLHASPMFAELSPMLKNAQNRPIEQLTVDKTGVVIRFMQPVGSEMRFSLRDRGFGYLSEEKQEALVILLEEFLPRVVDSHRYAFKKKRTLLLNGHFEFYYQYTILNSYKTSLVRAPYYDGSNRRLSFPSW